MKPECWMLKKLGAPRHLILLEKCSCEPAGWERWRLWDDVPSHREEAQLD
jgi:hypothetical protein